MRVEARHLGTRISAARLARAWARDDLARAVGVSRHVIYRIEKNQFKQPRVGLVRDIAQALEVTVDELLSSGPRPRVKVSRPDQVEIPVVVTQLLMTGRLGNVVPNELEQLVRLAHDEMFASDMKLLELEFLWRRACGAMHRDEFKQALDAAFERIRQELLEQT